MGHQINAQREYELLRQRMDHSVSPVPDSPAIRKILELLYSPEEAEFARRIPVLPTRLSELARRLEWPEDELRDKLTDLARRGLIFDCEKGGERYYSLPPVVGGLFEYVLMRTRAGVPMEELSRLFTEYLENEEVLRAVYTGETPFARAYVREDALPEGDHAEILDYERIGRLLETASVISIGLCPCRHKNSHLGTACDRPQRTCISLNAGAEAMIHSGISERIDAREALRVIDECKAAGLAQVGDNVQRSIGFVCNCCRCCCTLTRGVRTLGINHAIVSSNWIPEIDADRCVACGRCEAACPVQAVAVEGLKGGKSEKGEKGLKGLAVIAAGLCLGCGVCYSQCRSGAIRMKPRAQRVFTPETTFDMVGHMAIERGKVAEVLFEDPERLSLRAIGRLLRLLEKSPPWKAAMAVRPLRSAFLNAIFAVSKDVREEKARIRREAASRNADRQGK